jgi:hypothetical protein
MAKNVTKAPARPAWAAELDARKMLFVSASRALQRALAKLSFYDCRRIFYIVRCAAML